MSGNVSAHEAGAVQRLRTEFGATFPDETIREALRASAAALHDAKVKAFVPVLAERAARERLRNST